MKIDAAPSQLSDALRAIFFARDREVWLAKNCYARLDPSTTRTGLALADRYLAWVSIAETALTAPAAIVTFANIPQNFRTLALPYQARTDAVAESDNVRLQFNGSAVGYDTLESYFNSAGNVNIPGLNGVSMLAGVAEAANSRANNFSPTLLFIEGYARADRDKWAFGQSGVFGDASANADLYNTLDRGRWRSLAAVTSITLYPAVGPNFVAGSIFQLYGVL